MSCKHTTTLITVLDKPVQQAQNRKYGESDDRSENLDFMLLRQEDPFGELLLEICFQTSGEFTFL